MPPLPIRPRRLRHSDALRRLVREHAVSPAHLLVETSPAEPARAESPLTAFGGAWLSLPDDASAAEAAVQAARAALGEEGCLAVDLRAVAADPVEAAVRMRAAGADLVAINGADTGCVRDAFEACGDVHAVIVACASFPLDAPDATPSSPPAAEAWVRAGADLLLIEPALPNLDRIRAMSASLPVPVLARVTPQESASYGAAFERGWLDGGKIPPEVLMSVSRAGARIIVIPAAWADTAAGSAA